MNRYEIDGGNPPKAPGKTPGSYFSPLNIILFLVVMLSLYYLHTRSSQPAKEVSWNEFEALVRERKVDRIVIVNNEAARVYLKKDTASARETGRYTAPSPDYTINIGSPEVFEDKLSKAEQNYPPSQHINIEYTTESSWLQIILLWSLPFFLLYLIGKWMTKTAVGGGGGMNVFSFGQTGARLFEKDEKNKITFKDIAGLDEAKEEMEEIVDFLKNPQEYTRLGAKIPKGILLVGPPGTGKTLLARAVAGEAQVSFFSLSGSEFVEMFVGVGASRVRDLFKKAKDKAPCIIFIDEIDAIGRSRGTQQSFNTNDERENTLNQLLTEMDGFSANSGVIVLAATNRGDVLDRALLRPGRFDRHIYLELPDMRERKEIFLVHMHTLTLGSDVDPELLAAQTPGFSGADIANICNEAALIAARNKKMKIGREDFSNAIDRIIGGMEKRKKIISTKERKIVAFHEAGHALATCHLKGLKEIVKVSIIPRGKSLGAAWYRPEELQLITLTQLTNEICILLAGRAAEEVIFGEITSGALDDLERATKQGYAMVAFYGLGKRIGNISFYDSTGNRDNAFMKPYSEDTSRLIDEEVITLVNDCYAKVRQLFISHKDELEKIGRLLLEKEVIYKADLENIIQQDGAAPYRG